MMQLVVAAAQAGTFSCSGKVTLLALHPQNGIVQVSNGHGVHYLCQLQAVYQGVPAEVCSAMYSMLLAAKASGKAINFMYSSPDDAKSCATLGNWAVPDPFPYFIEIKE